MGVFVTWIVNCLIKLFTIIRLSLTVGYVV